MDSAPGKIALNCRNLIALVPGIIKGTRTVLRSDQWFPRHSAISIEIGDPVLPAGTDFQPIVRLRDQVRQSMFARCGEPDLEELVSPNRCLVEHDGESHEARFKRLRRRNGNSATVHLRWRKPVATFAMVRRAQRNAKFCPALRRSRCARRHMAPLGGLRYSTSPNGACGRRRAEHQTEARGQRFSVSRLCRPAPPAPTLPPYLSLPP